MQPFSLLVKPAGADCNLRCRYCFYLGKCSLYPETATHRMSDAVLEQMVSSFMRTKQPQHSFGWQGGEPTLMGEPFFKRVTELQQQYGRKGAVVSNGLQTNGTLITDELAAHLARYNFLVGVSVDGPAAIHDRNRITADGRPSHAKVWEGIERLKQASVDYNVLTLVNHDNVRDPAGLYHYLCDNDVLFHQYIECVEFDRNGDPLTFTVSAEEWGGFLCGIFDEWVKGDTHRVSVRLFDSVLTMMVDGFPNVCQMGTNCCQYLVVEHTGDVYPCDFFVQEDLRLGNVMNDSWEELLASPKYREFGERKHCWNERCAECSYLGFCAGDCQKQRFYGKQDPSQLSWLCAAWKRFYAHAMPTFEELAQDIRGQRAAERRRRAISMARGDVGRNDPCPCGSGRKFKKCCGAG